VDIAKITFELRDGGKWQVYRYVKSKYGTGYITETIDQDERNMLITKLRNRTDFDEIDNDAGFIYNGIMGE